MYMKRLILAAVAAFMLPSCGSVTDPQFMNNAAASQRGGIVEFEGGERAFMPAPDKPAEHPFFR